MLVAPEISEQEIIILLTGLFLVGGCAVIAALLFLKDKAKSAKMWREYKFEFVIVASLLIPAYFGGLPFLAILLLFNVAALRELSSICGVNHNSGASKCIYVLTSIILVSVFFTGHTYIGAVLFIALILLQVAAVLNPIAIHQWITISTCALLLLLPLIHIIFLGNLENGFLWIFFVYMIVEVNDVAASLIGNIFGRHHPFPYISPMKTTEGTIGGLIFSVSAGILFAIFALNFPWMLACGAALTIWTSGVLGDLFISTVKRDKKIKDFPTLHPLMGGSLDIYDAFLFAAPSFYIFLLIFIL